MTPLSRFASKLVRQRTSGEYWSPTGIERASQLLALVGGGLQTDQHLFVVLMNTLAAACVAFEAARDLSDDARGLADALYPVTTWMLMAFSVPGMPRENLRWSLDSSEWANQQPELAGTIASLEALSQRLAHSVSFASRSGRFSL